MTDLGSIYFPWRESGILILPLYLLEYILCSFYLVLNQK